MIGLNGPFDGAGWQFPGGLNLTSGLTTQMLVGGGLGVAPVWTTATGSGAPMRGTSPTITTSLIMSDGATIGQAAGPLVAFDDTNNFLEVTGCSVGINQTTPTARLHVKGTMCLEGSGSAGDNILRFDDTTVGQTAQWELYTKISGNKTWGLYERITGTTFLSFAAGGGVTFGAALTVPGSSVFYSNTNASAGYQYAGIQLRESLCGGTSGYLCPRISFHWGGVVASQIGITSGGMIQILDNPGTGYESLACKYVKTNRLGLFGTYDATQVQGIWSISESYPISTASNTFGAVYGLGYCYETYGSGRSGFGHQIKFVSGGGITGTVSLSYGYAQFPRLYFDGETRYLDNSQTYGGANVIGIKNGYYGYGISQVGTYLMFDGNGYGGIYDTSAYWHYYQLRGYMGLMGSSTSTSYKVYVNGGNLYVAGSIVAASDISAINNLWSHDGGVHSLSDERLKKEIKPMTKGLSIIKALKPISFKYKDDNKQKLDSEHEIYGLSAQELQLVFPEAVEIAPNMTHTTTTRVHHKNEDGTIRIEDVEGGEYDPIEYLSIDHAKINMAMINAIIELAGKVDKLEKEKPV